MNIAHLFSRFRFATGGPVRAVIDLSGALASAGHNVTIITWDDHDIPEAWKGGDNASATHVRIHRIRPPALPGQLLSLAQLSALTKVVRHQDVLHFHGVWEPSTMQVARIARRIRVPYVISPRGMLDDYSIAQKSLKKQAYLALCGRRMLNNAARIHLTAQGELQQSQRHFPPGRGIVIPNLVDLQPYRSLPGSDAARREFKLADDGPPIVAFLGRLHSIKALDILIRAAGRARREGIDLRLVLAGPGPADYVDYLKRTAQAAAVADRLTFTGLITGDLKLSLLQAADLFALPSHHENFGFVLVEAMACGTPVLASRGVLIWPDIHRAQAGFVADVDDESIAQALVQALSLPDRLRTIGDNARNWVLEELDPNQLVRKFEDMYRSTLAAPSLHH